MKKQKKSDINIEISVKRKEPIPDTVDELINSYGTYNVQPTSDTSNSFPAISQGLAKKSENTK